MREIHDEKQRTAGGAGAKILILIVEIIRIGIDPLIVRIPIRIDETNTRPTFSFVLSKSRLETILYLSGLLPQYKTAVLFLFLRKINYPA